MAASGDVEDFITQNRHLSDLVESFRSISESEKHWKSRREFIYRNINDYEDPHLDHLLALSMVWANNVFLGCRYSPDLLDKVKEMAEGIVVEDAPVFKTRDEIVKNQQKVTPELLKEMFFQSPDEPDQQTTLEKDKEPWL